MMFRVGDVVRHLNEGRRAGSAGVINFGLCEIVSIVYQGENVCGERVYAAKLKTQHGNISSPINTALLKKQGVK